MKKIVVFCLLAAATVMAQKQSVAVLPPMADPEAKLTQRELEMLTDRVRNAALSVLPSSDFNLLPQATVESRLGGKEAVFNACKEGTCIGELTATAQVDFGARYEVFILNNKLWFKFELYGTLKGDKNPGDRDRFTEDVKDFKAMEALIDKKVPEAFKKIIVKAKTQMQFMQEACEAAGALWVDETCKSKEQILCEAQKKVWVGEKCWSKEEYECRTKNMVWNDGICQAQTQANVPIAQAMQEQSSSQPITPPSNKEVKNFTQNQRILTWTLNLVPGIGSIAIMDDLTGAAVQWVLGGSSIPLIVIASAGGDNEVTSTVGGLLLISSYAYSTYRSITYGRPQNTALSEYGGFNMAIFPNKNGKLNAFLMYNKGF